MNIKCIKAREILDSRGNPTIEVDLCSNKNFASSKVPSGASTGIHEAVELRDKEKRYNGKGVKKAVNNVNNKISKKIIGMNSLHQNKIDNEMIKLDGTKNKSKLGANAILGVSLSTARLAALDKKIPLYEHLRSLTKNKDKKYKMPIPFLNVINGGEHADNDLSFQEFMIAPHGKTFKESLQIGAEVYHCLKGLIKKKYGGSSTAVGDEGGFAPNMKTVKEPLDMIMKALKILKYENKVKIALDPAASEFYKNGKYYVDGKYITGKELSDLYVKLANKYPIISIEDPFAEDDWESFKHLTKRIGNKVQIVGDDLLVTNPLRIVKAIKEKSCNALLLKVNQIGSVSESIEAAELALKNNWNIMVSHRSGETSDTFIADLVVALGCGQIKSGAPCRSERLEKYNRLLKIEEELGKNAVMNKGIR
ncbi:MAG: phosphopyruvate hydratase [Candidatus Woesearchaeota archaeon]